MKKLVVVLVTLVVVLSAVSSYLGVVSYSTKSFVTLTTPRGDRVEFLKDGLYRYSSKALAAEGIPWDAVRLFFGIPFLAVAFILFLRNSLRGTLLLAGVLANFFYQYLLWAYGWAFNPLFLIYVAIYSMSLVAMIFLFSRIDIAAVKNALREKFPTKTLEVFMFVIAGFLLLLWLSKLIPASISDTLPSELRGEQTAISQASDLGFLVPLSLAVGILLVKRNGLGFVLSPVILVFSVNMCLSILTGTIVGGLETGFMPLPPIVMFILILGFSAALLVKVLLNISPSNSFLKFQNDTGFRASSECATRRTDNNDGRFRRHID